MSEDYMIDIYDENMKPLGSALRSQAHKEGLWHKSFHCWIVKRASDGHHRVLLQLRSKNKDTHPSLMDISAAGHLKVGETPHDGIKNIEEELGIRVNFESLNKLFTINHVYEKDGYINHEFNPTYLLETDKNLSELELNPMEVDGVLEASVDDLKNLFNHKVNSIYVSGLLLDEFNNYIPYTGAVAIKDFVPHEDSYYVKVMDTIKRYFENKQHDFDAASNS